jgi:hypothetical protein
VYRIARTVIDVAAPRELRGEVLWVELWRSTAERENKPAEPLVHYLAVDDGAGERTTAWALPSAEAHRARPGDVVAIRVHPWSRRVVELSVEESRAARAAAKTPTPATSTPAASVPLAVPASSTPAGVAGIPGFAVGAAAAVVSAAVLAAGAGRRAPLLGIDDVGAALGRPVTIDGAASQVSLGPFELTTYSAADDPAVPLLVLGVARGRAVGVVMRGLRGRGTPLSVPADEAFAGPGWAVARRGDLLVRVSADDAGTTVLPELLETALARLAEGSRATGV